MKILALEREDANRSPQDVQPHLIREAQTVWCLTQAGVIREIYFEAEKHTAVIMLEASGESEAREVLE